MKNEYPMALHHIGLACRDIKEQIKALSKLHPRAQISKIIFDPQQDAHLCMVDTGNNHRLELIQGPPVKNFVEKGIQLYHLCYEVEAMEKARAHLLGAGALQISEAKGAALFNQRQVAFFYTAQGIVELLEAEK